MQRPKVLSVQTRKRPRVFIHTVLGWGIEVADAQQPFSSTERAGAGLSSLLAAGFGVFPYPEVPQHPSKTTGTECCIFSSKGLESCSLLPTTQRVGTHKARSKVCSVLRLKKGVMHTSDMA